MNTNTYKIGKTAELAGVNRETVRYYERIKMISPPARRRSGYREFSQIHIDQIRFIKRAQDLGFTLSEIRELLSLQMDENTTCSEIKREAEEKYRNVVNKIEDLTKIKNRLLNLIDSCSGEGSTGDCPILEALEEKN
ncbi:MAG: heavy metal-responsive transcriptional regulator [Balneolaceae bacterium]